MASLLRQLVASPRVRHPEADLDLCYVTDTIIATSGPGSSYPQVAYRTPLTHLVKYLDAKHGADWAIWEFRAEGTGYADEHVYGRVRHYPWPDHHPPPFALVPLIMGSMRDWLQGKEGRVAVVHCKAGKGRSGTVACSYLISEEGWSPEAAMQRFTDRRMRPGFGVGISIPSQRRTISYVERWTRGGKRYVERGVEILEVHVWGLRNGVKLGVEGYVDEGKVIKTFHTFGRHEREIVRGGIRRETGFADAALEAMGKNKKRENTTSSSSATPSNLDGAPLDDDDDAKPTIDRAPSDALLAGGDVVFRPTSPIRLPTNDVNLDFERRNQSKYGGFTMVSAVAHVWFNAFFEGNGAEQAGRADTSGVFEIEWEAMDGIKGSFRKGTKAFDRVAVVWKSVEEPGQVGTGEVVGEPAVGEGTVRQMRAASETPVEGAGLNLEKRLGLRAPDAASAGVSRASSVEGSPDGSLNRVPDEIEGVKAYHSPQGDGAEQGAGAVSGGASSSAANGTSAGLVSGIQHLSTADASVGGSEAEMRDSRGSPIGNVHETWR
ncbi:Telomerase protein component 1 [Teratosphaeriaceae sp. CCFEE 6253]|nr:Telomerase protein component 1 [Teratosphaeriaceae sp. CCFEE 6253]